MNILFRIYHFVRYYITAGNLHHIHSPFVYKLYETVVNEDRFYVFDNIKNYKEKLLRNHQYVAVEDFGTKKSRTTKISTLATKGSMPLKYVFFLYKLAYLLKPKVVIELGTQLGVSTYCLSKISSVQKLFTFEGAKQLIQVAQQNDEHEERVKWVKGDIDLTLQEKLAKIENIDFVLVDANHTYDATIKYFKLLKTKVNDKSCLVFDDIYWSKGMLKAWNEIVADKQVTLSLDFYKFGIVFFRKEQPKQHFVLRY